MSDLQGASANYPMLFSAPEPPLPEQHAAAAEPQVPSCVPGAPPADESTNALAEMEQTHATRCAMCRTEFPASGHIALLKLSCGHQAHFRCAQLLLASRNTAAVGVTIDTLGGMAWCNHCRDRAMATGAPIADTDPETSRRFCLERLKQMHADTYRDQDVDAIIDGGELRPDDVRTMLGESATSAALSGLATNVRNGWRALVSRTDDETVWSAASDALNEVRGAEGSLSDAAARARDRSVPYDEEFVAEMCARGRTLDDIFVTFKYSLPHIFLAGVQTIGQLRALGFDPRRHLTAPMRCTMPLFLLAERYGLTYAEHLRDLSNEQLIACAFHRYELPLIGLTASALVERRMTPALLARSKLRLDDWIRFAGLQTPHAIAMGFAPDDLVRHWPRDLERADSPAYALYRDLCQHLGADPMSAEQIALANRARQQMSKRRVGGRRRRHHHR